MLRSIAHVLVVVMLFASGRLLACGLGCLDELAVRAAASCHQDSTTGRSGLPAVALAEEGDGVHACLPETPEPHVTAAKPGAAHALVIPPPTGVLFTTVRPADPAGTLVSFQPDFESPHSPAPSVLRI